MRLLFSICVSQDLKMKRKTCLWGGSVLGTADILKKEVSFFFLLAVIAEMIKVKVIRNKIIYKMTI